MLVGDVRKAVTDTCLYYSRPRCMIPSMADHLVNLLASAVRVVLVAWILCDVYQTVVIPRATPTRVRLARYVTRDLWLVGRWRAARATTVERRERLLGNFAPFTVIVLLAAWVAVL